MFRNRDEAGRMLGKALQHHAGKDVVVLGLPRGGVPVAVRVAEALGATVDITLARKIGHPNSAELAVAAVAEDGTLWYNEGTLRHFGVPLTYVERQARVELKEIQRRLRVLRPDLPRPDLRDRVVILVDDGIATGATMHAAVKYARSQGAARIVVAAPVGAPDTLERFARFADEVVCLEAPDMFSAVGQFYRDFDQVTDAEVYDCLEHAWALGSGGGRHA
jgi:putative phosphoribosyl transferase